jgi:parallel beta-helix repeat protein
MLTNRRSSSLLACTLIAMAGGVAAYAGPLQPASGPIVATHKTLTEVEPRIPISAATTPGDADSVFKITQRGSYYLTGNVTGAAGMSGIEVASSGVTIDLNGFDLLGVNGSLDGIRSSIGGQTMITIKNGSIRFWDQDGIDFETAANTLVRVENVHTGLNAGRGLAIYSGIVHNCTALNNEGQGIIIDTGLIRDCHSSFNDLTGIWVTGNGATIEGCTAFDNTTNGIVVAESAIVRDCVARNNGDVGITTGAGAMVRDCISDDNGEHGYVMGATSTIVGCAARVNGDNGIIANGNSLVTGNTAVGNGLNGLAAGIRLQGGNSRAEGNNCTNNPRGLDVVGTGNFIVRNTCAGNTTNWVIAANNVYGPIINATVPASPAVNGVGGVADQTGTTHPHANFSY